MILLDEQRQLIDSAAARLDDHQRLRILVDLAFPFVNGRDFRYDVDAGGQLFADQTVGDLLSHLFAGGCHVGDRMRARLVRAAVCRAQFT